MPLHVTSHKLQEVSQKIFDLKKTIDEGKHTSVTPENNSQELRKLQLFCGLLSLYSKAFASKS